MISLLLILIVVAVFAMVFAYESVSDGNQVRIRSSGLLTWLISGNWPAKVGAGLVIIGVGALLRYAFANIDLPAEMKLGGGAVASAVLGVLAMQLKSQPKRRAVYLALSGAAFGVAYLTAYSAYGFFAYLNDVNALALLALVSIAAGAFAVNSNAMSMAILAMVGAYIAPKFAIGAPGVLQVYGYYLAISILSLVMVTLRGWRPLIHLSFLFTLAGALFFGWSSRFYEPSHYTIMQPLLLALTMVHLAMPLLERRHIRSARVIRFDSLYFLLLPLVSAGLTLKISPDLNVDGAIGLGCLATLWCGAAVILHARKKDEVARHALVAIALGLGAIFCYQEDLPWLQLGLALSVAGMAAGTRLGWPRSSLELACAATTLFGVLNVIHSVMAPETEPAFLNALFAHRLLSATLMMIGAWLGMGQSIRFAKTLGLLGGSWAILSVLSELLRLHIDFLPQLVYGVILAGMLLSMLLGSRSGFAVTVGGVLLFGLVACGWWAMYGVSDEVGIAYLVLTFFVLLAMAWAGRDSARKDSSDFSPSMAIGLLPFALLPWAMVVADLAGLETDFFEASVAMLGIAAAGLSARYWLSASLRWNERIQPLHVYLAAFALIWVTIFHIERGVWPVVFEVLALGYLLAYVARRSREQSGVGFGIGAMMVLSVALFLQAMLLRGFGPDVAVMDVSDVNKMQLPAAVSLMWVIFGAGLAWWGTQSISRTTWTVGALLLAVAAIKLVFFDFGTLGQLGNILAFIAAGLVFLGVAWFAPIPPKPQIESHGPVEAPKSVPSASEQLSQDEISAVEPVRSSPQSEPKVEIAPPRDSCKPAAEIDASAATLSYRRQESSSRAYREEPRGINGLWFILVGLAIVIAVCSSVWHKYNRQQERRLERQRIAEANWKAQQQAELDNPKEAQAPFAAKASPSEPGSDKVLPEGAAAAMLSPTKSAAASSDGAKTIKVIDACSTFVDRLPSDFVVYAGGAYKGHKPDNNLNPSRGTGQFDVFANSPGRPVVLALGAYESSIWNIRWAFGTNVVGILVSGYYPQTVLGLQRDIPVLNVSYESQSPCGFFYLTRENANQADATLRKILGRSAQSYVLASDGRIDLGPAMTGLSEPAQSSSRIERHVDRNGGIEYRQVLDGR